MSKITLSLCISIEGNKRSIIDFSQVKNAMFLSMYSDVDTLIVENVPAELEYEASKYIFNIYEISELQKNQKEFSKILFPKEQ